MYMYEDFLYEVVSCLEGYGKILFAYDSLQETRILHCLLPDAYIDKQYLVFEAVALHPMLEVVNYLCNLSGELVNVNRVPSPHLHQ